MEYSKTAKVDHFIGEYGTMYSKSVSRGGKSRDKIEKTFMVLYNKKFCRKHGGISQMESKACFSNTDWRVAQMTDYGSPIIMCEPQSGKYKVFGLLSLVVAGSEFPVNVVEWIPSSVEWLESI